MSVPVEPHALRVEKCLVYAPPLALRRAHYRFRHWYSTLTFSLLRDADEWAGRAGRPLAWCRKPLNQAPAAF